MMADNNNQNTVLIIALTFAACVLLLVGFIIFRYHPTGIEKDGQGNIVLSTAIGDGDVIPQDCIQIIPMPSGLMKNLIRTNGAAYGRVLYGHFENRETGTEMFLYLTGKPDTVCFKYEGQLYVTDDWRTDRR